MLVTIEQNCIEPKIIKLCMNKKGDPGAFKDRKIFIILTSYHFLIIYITLCISQSKRE